jgi:hypothetical protein
MKLASDWYPLMARSGPVGPVYECLFIGEDRKLPANRQTDANDPERTEGPIIP